MKNSPPGNRKENVKMENLDKIYEICIKHLEEYPGAIEYVPEQYLTEELCIAALKGTQDLDWDGEKIWEHIPMDKLTPRVCEAAACYNRYALEHIPDSCKTSKVYFEAVKSFGYLLKVVPIAFHSKEMYINSVSQNGGNLEYVPAEKRSEEICKAAFNAENSGGAAVEFIPDKYLTEDMCLSAVSSDGKLLDVIPTHYKTVEVCLSSLKHSSWVTICGNSKADDMAFSNYVKKHIPAKIAEEVCERFDEYLSKLKKDKEQENEWRRLISENPLYIKNIPEDKRSGNLCEIAIKQEGLTLKYVPEKYMCGLYCKWAVWNNPDALMYVPEEMRKEVIDYVKESCQYVGVLFGNSPYKEYFL